MSTNSPTSSKGGRVSCERLAEIEHPLERADDVLAGLTEEEKVEALAAHPAIGQKTGLSPRSAAEQGTDEDPCVLVDLAALNMTYERKFGFRFVVFVESPTEDGDPRRPARAPGAHA